ncbi:MAG: chloride channel protein [Myxococcales bacterium]|nr:chloride channel protein [Myxococcales bacterium]
MAATAKPRVRTTGHLFMVSVAVACGIAGALGAVAFRFLIQFFQAGFFEGLAGVRDLFAKGLLAEAHDPLAVANGIEWYWRLLLPAIGGLIVGPLIYVFAREAKGHGVPEVMAAVALRGGVIRRRVVAVKALASAICIGSGGSVGREGPIVQIASALGSSIGQMLRVPASQLRTIVGCGAAAGIAATFNAPIAGALFAAEIVVGNFGVAQLSPIVIASVVATVLSRFLLGNTPAFEVPPYELASPFELLPYMVVGFIAGLVALVFMRSLYATEDLFERMPIPEYTKAAVGGLLVGAIGITLPNVFGVGYSTITQALTGQLPALLLGVLLVAKVAATSLTLGSGGSGGIFAPSLFLGAMTGGFFGTFVHEWFPDVTASSGAYALVTMGAVVAAATHAPITAIIMIFELTQTIDIIPPLMAACVVSTLVTTFLQRESIYTLKLSRRGIDLYEEEEKNVLKSLYVHDVIDRDPERLPVAGDFQTVVERVLASEHTDFFVVDERDRLLGAIHLRELTRMLAEQDLLRGLVVAGDLLEPDQATVTEDDDLDVVMQLFSRSLGEEIAVVDRDDARKMVGSVHKSDVIHAYNREVLRRDLAGSISSNVIVASKGQQVEFGGGYVLQEIQPPPRFFGRTIRELAIGSTTGAQVVLLRKRQPADGKSAVRVPTADDRIEEGDRLVVAGTRAAVESLDVI